LENLKILFADDSATMRQIMEKTFAAEPMEVVTVPSGEAAIAKAVEIGPAVVIADAGMPGINGYELCRALRQDPALAGVPVLILGGVSAPYDEAKGREAGVTDSMKKPFDTAKMIEKVTELAGAAPAVSAAPAAAAAAAPRVPAPPAAPPAPFKPPPAPKLAPPFTADRPPAAPAAPPRPQPSAGPVAAAPSAKPIKETMEFARSARPHEPDVRPIEIDEREEEGAAIQVGTLAELAQMDERGGQLEPTAHDKPIDVTAPGPRAAVDEDTGPMEKAVAAAVPAAADIAARIGGGLTAEQAEAIRSLTAEVVERVVWEVVPELAEAIIKEYLARLLEE